MGRSGRAAAASRENLSALLNMGNRLPSPPESKTYCYWSNLGLVKENVIKSMFVTAEVPEGLRPTMSRVGPEELNTTDQPSTPLASPSTFLGRPLARASSSLSGSLRPEDDPPAPDKKKKNLVTKAADKFMKIMRKKH